MDRHGGLDVLRYGDLPEPVAQAGQVLARPWRHSASTRVGISVANWC